jgi:hypothetical protein
MEAKGGGPPPPDVLTRPPPEPMPPFPPVRISLMRETATENKILQQDKITTIKKNL